MGKETKIVSPAKRNISLWGLADVVLIVLEETGIVYENQVMGNCCVQASAEGICVPLSPDYPIDSRGRPAVMTLGERLGEAVLCAHYLDEKLAVLVDVILNQYPETRGIQVDRDKLSDSGEAWLYVKIEPTESSPIKDFGPCKGVLTWLNSD